MWSEWRNTGTVLTIKGLDTWQIQLPAKMLPVNLAQISHEESVLVSRFAGFMVNCLDPSAERITDQLLGRWHNSTLKIGRLQCFDEAMAILIQIIRILMQK